MNREAEKQTTDTTYDDGDDGCHLRKKKSLK